MITYHDNYRFGSGAIAASTAISFYSDLLGTLATLITSGGVSAANPQTTDADGDLTVYTAGVWPLYYKAAGDTEYHLANCMNPPPSAFAYADDYGPLAFDNVTDNAVTLNAAMSIPVNGTTVYIPPGVGRTSQTIVVPSYTTLQGPSPLGGPIGWPTSMIKATANSYLDAVIATAQWYNGGAMDNYINIKDLCVDGYGAYQAVATTVAAGSNGGTLSNVAAWSSPSAGVLAVASTTGFATAGNLRVLTTSGIVYVHYTGVSGNTFTGCTMPMDCTGLTTTVSTGAAVAPGLGFGIADATWRSRIERVTCQNTAGSGFFFGNMSRLGTLVTGTLVESDFEDLFCCYNGNHGFESQCHPSNNASPTDITMAKVYCQNPTWDGLHVFQSGDWSFSRIHPYSCGRHDIWTYWSSARISDCLLETPGQVANVGNAHGIFVGAIIGSVIVKGNQWFMATGSQAGNTYYGLYAQAENTSAQSRIVVDGNDFGSPASYGTAVKLSNPGAGTLIYAEGNNTIGSGWSTPYSITGSPSPSRQAAILP